MEDFEFKDKEFIPSFFKIVLIIHTRMEHLVCARTIGLKKVNVTKESIRFL